MNDPAGQRSRTVTWEDPRASAASAAKLSGLQFVEALADGTMPPPPMAQLVGIRVISVDEGEVRIRCTPEEAFYNPVGVVHGGLLCTLLDTAMGLALRTLLPAGVGFTTIEIKVNFLKSVVAGEGDLEILGRVTKSGRRVAFAEGEAHDAGGSLVGNATSSLLIA